MSACANECLKVSSVCQSNTILSLEFGTGIYFRDLFEKNLAFRKMLRKLVAKLYSCSDAKNWVYCDKRTVSNSAVQTGAWSNPVERQSWRILVQCLSHSSYWHPACRRGLWPWFGLCPRGFKWVYSSSIFASCASKLRLRKLVYFQGTYI